MIGGVPRRVDAVTKLDGDHFGAPPGHGHGERPGAGAGVDHELPGADIRFPDEAVSSVGT